MKHYGRQRTGSWSLVGTLCGYTTGETGPRARVLFGSPGAHLTKGRRDKLTSSFDTVVRRSNSRHVAGGPMGGDPRDSGRVVCPEV